MTKVDSEHVETVKEKMRHGMLAAGVSLVPVAAALPVYAESTGATANSALVSAATETAQSVIANMSAMIPIALGVMGIGLGVSVAIRFFKRLTRTSAG